MVYTTLQVIPIHITADIKPKDKLELLILESISLAHEKLYDKDIIVIAQKIISKAEGRIVNLDLINPSDKAIQIARKYYKDARIVEMRQGFICANAGIDQSNVKDSKSHVVLLPIDSDRSARKIRHSIKGLTRKNVAVVIADTFGRPFREGQTNVAVGIAGIKPIRSYVG